MSIQLPLRPKNDAEFPQLKKIDKDIVAYAVLFGADNQTAFMRFHPEFLADSKTMNQAGKVAARQFWSWGKVRDYRQSYEETVEEFLNGKKRKQVADSEDKGTSDKRKDRAIRKLVSDCLDAIEGNAALDPETLKDFVTMAKALGVLKDEEEVQEKPRRYLPEVCSSCIYRSFIESYVKTGEIENSCLRCKALAIAEEQGFHYDPKTLLNPENTKSDEQDNQAG